LFLVFLAERQSGADHRRVGLRRVILRRERLRPGGERAGTRPGPAFGLVRSMAAAIDAVQPGQLFCVKRRQGPLQRRCFGFQQPDRGQCSLGVPIDHKPHLQPRKDSRRLAVSASARARGQA
jgi:hypothetical protein